jgi:hypothetical protein
MIVEGTLKRLAKVVQTINKKKYFVRFTIYVVGYVYEIYKLNLIR